MGQDHHLLTPSIAGGELSCQEVFVVTPGWAQEKISIRRYHQCECSCEGGGPGTSCEPPMVGGLAQCPLGRGEAPLQGASCFPLCSACMLLFSSIQARKNQVVAGKKEAVKVVPPKAQKVHNALGVAKNNEINLKK